jgi:hypothetical protein
MKNRMNHAATCFWADQVVLGSTEDSAILLKYNTFQDVFFMLSSKKVQS